MPARAYAASGPFGPYELDWTEREAALDCLGYEWDDFSDAVKSVIIGATAADYPSWIYFLKTFYVDPLHQVAPQSTKFFYSSLDDFGYAFAADAARADVNAMILEGLRRKAQSMIGEADARVGTDSTSADLRSAFPYFVTLYDSDHTGGSWQSFRSVSVTDSDGDGSYSVELDVQSSSYDVSNLQASSVYCSSVRMYLGREVASYVDGALEGGRDVLLFFQRGELLVVTLPHGSWAAGDSLFDGFLLSDDYVGDGQVDSWRYHGELVCMVDGRPSVLFTELGYNERWYRGVLSVDSYYHRVLYAGGGSSGDAGSSSATGSGGTTDGYEPDTSVYDDNGDTSGEGTAVHGTDQAYQGSDGLVHYDRNLDLTPITSRLDALNSMVAQLGRDLDSLHADLSRWLSELPYYLRRIESLLMLVDSDINAARDAIVDALSGVGTSISSAKDAIDSRLLGIDLDMLGGFRQLHRDLEGAVRDVVVGDPEDAMGIFDKIYAPLTHKFPFSIPWDIVSIFGLFVHEPVTPVFDLPVPMVGGPWLIHVNLSPLDAVAGVARACELIIFSFVLALKTPKILRSQEV